MTHELQWKWWIEACQTGDFDGYLKTAPICVDEPMSGFYETRHKHKQTGVVTRGVTAIWRKDDGTLCGRQGLRALTAEAVIQVWPWLAKRPISHATYKTVINTGKFPDEIDADKIARADGLNDVEDLDQFAMIKDRIEDLTREAKKIIDRGAAKNTEESNSAADLADRIKKLEDRAESLRKEEKQPHLTAGAEVDLKWKPLVDAAGIAKIGLKRIVITPFLNAANEAYARSCLQAKATGSPPPAARPVTAGVAAARKVGLREEKTAIIEDYAACLAYFSDNQKIKDLIQQLANSAAKQGTCPTGCKIHTQQVAA